MKHMCEKHLRKFNPIHLLNKIIAYFCFCQQRPQCFKKVMQIVFLLVTVKDAPQLKELLRCIITVSGYNWIKISGSFCSNKNVLILFLCLKSSCIQLNLLRVDFFRFLTRLFLSLKIIKTIYFESNCLITHSCFG